MSSSRNEPAALIPSIKKLDRFGGSDGEVDALSARPPLAPGG
ncbi:MAG: hypothetical protein OEM98_19515 [Gammaproteobacteria bacterium]|nr:hypothetical protein [Gammaproteobacteria bacterium]